MQVSVFFQRVLSYQTIVKGRWFTWFSHKRALLKLLALYDTMSQGQTAPINSNNIDTDANAKQIQKLCVQFFLEDKIVLMNADGEYEKHPGSEHFSQIIADWLNEYNKQAAVPRVLVGPVLAVSNQDNNNNANPQPQVMPPNQGSQDLRQLNESFKNQILVLKQQLHQREEEYQKLLSNYRAATLAIGENALLSTVVCDQLRLIFFLRKNQSNAEQVINIDNVIIKSATTYPLPVIAQVAEELNENSDLWRLNEVNFYIKILEASMKGQIGASDEEKTALNENINLIMQGYANQFIKILDQFNENNFMLAQQHYLNLKHIAKYSKNNDQLLVRVEGAFQSFFSGKCQHVFKACCEVIESATDILLSTNPKRKQCIDTMNLWGKLFSYELLKEDSPTASIFKVFMLVDAVFKGLLEVKSISFGGVEDYIERVYRRYTTLIQQWAALIEELDCSKWQTLLSQCEGFSSQVDNIFTVFAELPRNGASRNLIVNYEESIQKFNSAMSLILKHYNHKILSTPNNSFNKGNLIYVFLKTTSIFFTKESIQKLAASLCEVWVGRLNTLCDNINQCLQDVEGSNKLKVQDKYYRSFSKGAENGQWYEAIMLLKKEGLNIAFEKFFTDLTIAKKKLNQAGDQAHKKLCDIWRQYNSIQLTSDHTYLLTRIIRLQNLIRIFASRETYDKYKSLQIDYSQMVERLKSLSTQGSRLNSPVGSMNNFTGQSSWGLSGQPGNDETQPLLPPNQSSDEEPDHLTMSLGGSNATNQN